MVQLILSLAVQFKWSSCQLDVSNVFLHGILKEEVYMAHPRGFLDATHPNHVCQLHKSIYGLKQAPKLGLNALPPIFYNWGSCL